MTKDVTDLVHFGECDGESLTLTQCICGFLHHDWCGPILSIYPEHPTECEKCGRKFYFTSEIRIFEVKD